VLWALLAAAQWHADRIRSETDDDTNSKSSHPLIRILKVGMLCAVFGDAFNVLQFLFRIFDGTHGGAATGAYALAKLFNVISKFCLIAILLLISKGRCISTVMTSGDLVRLSKLLIPFLLCAFVLEVWGDSNDARNYTFNFVYDTSFGMLVVAFDVFLLGFYYVSLKKTMKAETGADNMFFYRTWGMVYALWFLVLPASVICSWLLQSWSRYFFATAVTNSLRLAMYTGLVKGLWPTRKSYFKLDPMEMEPSTIGLDSDSFLAL